MKTISDPKSFGRIIGKTMRAIQLTTGRAQAFLRTALALLNKARAFCRKGHAGLAFMLAEQAARFIADARNLNNA